MAQHKSAGADTAPHSQKVLSDKIWKWIDEVIIAENFCPFAKSPRQQGKIRLVFAEVNTPENGLVNTPNTLPSEKFNDSALAVLKAIENECRYLDEHAHVETTLVACQFGLERFDDYLDVMDMAVDLLTEQGFDGIYQLASFHPRYQFQGEALNSTSHFTNRSIVPLFHLIREASISKGLRYIDAPEDIPERNIEHAQTLGKDFFTRYLH